MDDDPPPRFYLSPSTEGPLRVERLSRARPARPTLHGCAIEARSTAYPASLHQDAGNRHADGRLGPHGAGTTCIHAPSLFAPSTPLHSASVMIIRAHFIRVLLLGCALAAPAASQVPAAPMDLLAREGIIAAPPAGLPSFELVRTDSAPERIYRSMLGGTTILVSVMGPFHTWTDSSLEARHRIMEVEMRRRQRNPARFPADAVRQDSTHLIGEIRTGVPNGPRLIQRTYIPLTGALTTTSINVLTDAVHDSATEEAFTAFLDAARPDMRTRVNLLAREGIDVGPPPGFHPFQLFGSTLDARVYRSTSTSGSRMIVVTAMDPITSWGDGDLEARRYLLRGLMEGAQRNAAESESFLRQDATHLVWESPTRGVEGKRGIQRGYLPWVGPPAPVRIEVYDDSGASDPAADPAILAFLDAARPSRAPIPVAAMFRERGLAMLLPPGIIPPTARSSAEDETQLFISRSGDRYLMIRIVENREQQSSRWPPERRLRHMRRLMDSYLEQAAPRMDETTHVQDDLAWNDFRFSRMHDFRRVAGRGRIYSTQSGPHRMIAIMYFETNRDQIADEAAIVRMLDTVHLLANR
jgi:hypothetical protein